MEWEFLGKDQKMLTRRSSPGNSYTEIYLKEDRLWTYNEHKQHMSDSVRPDSVPPDRVCPDRVRPDSVCPDSVQYSNPVYTYTHIHISVHLLFNTATLYTHTYICTHMRNVQYSNPVYTYVRMYMYTHCSIQQPCTRTRTYT